MENRKKRTCEERFAKNVICFTSSNYDICAYKMKSELQRYKKKLKDQQKKRAHIKMVICGRSVDQYGIFEREKELKSLKKRKAKLRLVDNNKMQ
ncbi:unnamed protein product [Callosobruchus maculatus]|uniref:Uncharacterized protein n=1 Tax=Callosobruchus maculatus TaxID=64391 RepID=A0A653D443_CALMS|nr:unnamed protein product [Callosobruchus maculatus]